MKHLILFIATIFFLSNCNKPNLFDRKSDIKLLDGQWVTYIVADSNNNVLIEKDNLGTLNIFGVYMGGIFISNNGKNCQSSTWTETNFSDLTHKPEIGDVTYDINNQTISFSGLEFPLTFKILQFSATDIWLQSDPERIIKIKKLH
jgi:hypothetical protein